ncbi:hypothetical protein PG985_009330 [Apiospora marii]|uniref:uncharacterized protein n=1 Tax=Apiospora marii TaxID=335849 RepID=UPI00312D2137
MGDSGTLPDINVSNGTCYYTEHEETRGNFIACGNVAFGHWPCCQAGDMCLSLGNVNGCWDSDTGNTYLAGCTDPGFNARACPWKPPLFHEQEWVAIQQCHSGTGDDGTVWGGCKVDANQTTLEKLPHASCDPYCSVTVVQDASVLPAFASLPGSAGGAIKWTSGFDPTATAKGVRPAASATVTGEGSRSTTAGSVSPGSSITTPPDATATSPPPAATSSSSDDDGGLTVGAKAGIGVGAAGAALLIVAVVLLGLLVRRRRQRRNSQDQLANTTTAPHHPRPYDESPEQQQQQEQVMYYNNVFYNKTPPPPTTTTTDVVSGVGSQPYVGYKAELSADEAQRKGPWDQGTGFKSELAADETTMPRNEIGSSGGHDEVGGARAGSRRGSSGAQMTPGGGGGNGLSPHPSPHPSSAATAHSPFSAYSEVSTLYASSGGSGGGGGTGRWAPPPPTPPQQQQQQRHEDHPPGHEWPLPNGHGGSGGMQSFRERQQGRGGTWRSHGYSPS